MQIKANCPMIALLSALVAIGIIAAKLTIPVLVFCLLLKLPLSWGIRILIILTLIISCVPIKSKERIIVIEK